MAAMGFIGALVGLAGSFISASATIAGASAQARAQEQLAAHQAQVARIKGAQEQAAAQREQLETNRKAKLLQSSLQARASASGAGASDPTVTNLASGIAGRGQYQGALQMFTGELKSWDYNIDADLRQWQAEAASQLLMHQARSSAFGTILGGIGSMFSAMGKMSTGGMGSSWSPSYTVPPPVSPTVPAPPPPPPAAAPPPPDKPFDPFSKDYYGLGGLYY